MKKRILLLITVLAMLLSMQGFAVAASSNTISVDITDAQELLQDNLSGNNLIFRMDFPGIQGIKYTVTKDAVSALYNNPSVRYYTFVFNSLTVRADKNTFYDFDLDAVIFELTANSFDVTYRYKDQSAKKLTQTNLEMRYTVTGGQNLSAHSVAIMNGKQIKSAESSTSQLVFKTKELGSFEVIKFEFTDVKDPTLQWYYKYVNTAGAYGIVSGVGDGRFDPSTSINRCQLATLIIESTKHIINYKTNPNISFTDVTEDKWYYDYVNKCAAIGLMSGVGDGKFSPESTATRQEIAAVAIRFLNIVGSYNGKTVPNVSQAEAKELLKNVYSDSAQISDWALPSVYGCYELKIMSGTTNGFAPKRALNRAEGAKIFHDIYFNTIQ